MKRLVQFFSSLLDRFFGLPPLSADLQKIPNPVGRSTIAGNDDRNQARRHK